MYIYITQTRVVIELVDLVQLESLLLDCNSSIHLPSLLELYSLGLGLHDDDVQMTSIDGDLTVFGFCYVSNFRYPRTCIVFTCSHCSRPKS